MRNTFAVASAFALGALASPNPFQFGATTTTAAVTKTNSAQGWATPWKFTWETKTWGTITWSQPAPISTQTGVPPPPPSTTTYPTTAPTSYPSPSNYYCLNNDTATEIATDFRNSIALPFNTSAVQLEFASTFTDYSDSVIELINSGCPNGPIALGSPTFTSLSAFIAGQSSQPPIPFEIINMWYSCNTVVIRWRSAPGPGGPASPQQQITGIIAIETVLNPTYSLTQPFLIQTVYSEFNSGAWLYDLGVFVPKNCTA